MSLALVLKRATVNLDHTLSWLRMPIDDWRPAARSGHSTTLYKDVLIVYGGSTIGGRALGDVWKFDLVTGVFSMCSRLNTRRTGHTADLIAGRHEVLCFGGRAVQSANAVTNTLLRLDLETFTLREVKAKGEVPARRAFHSSCVCHDTIFIFGGFTDGPSSHLNDVHFLAPIVSQRGWSYVWHTPIVHGWVPRARLSSSWTYAWGYMFLIGGLDLHGLKPHMGDVHIFDPANKTWTQCSDGSSDVILDRIRVRPRCIATRDSHTTLFTGVSLISLRGSISDFDRFDVLGPASA